MGVAAQAPAGPRAGIKLDAPCGQCPVMVAEVAGRPVPVQVVPRASASATVDKLRSEDLIVPFRPRSGEWWSIPEARSSLRLCFLVILFGLARSSVEAGDPPKKVDDIPWAQRTWEQRAVESTYEDEFSNKNKMVFVKDPFTWTYSKEFADRFGMPKEWIDPGLKGALAVAWRTTSIGPTYCGHGGDPNLCWPVFTCQWDLYVDSKAPIPWRFNNIDRDFLWRGLSSLDHVPSRKPAPRRLRYAEVAGSLESKGPPFYTSGFKYLSGSYRFEGGALSITYFDRSYAPGVVLLGMAGPCPDPKANEVAMVRFFTQQERDRTQGRIQNYAHIIELSKEYMARIASIYEPEGKRQKESNPVRQHVLKKYAPN